MYQTAFTHGDDDQLFVAPIAITPIFSAISLGAASIVGFLAQTRRIFLSRRVGSLESSATAIATRPQLINHFAHVFALVDQTSVNDPDQIWVVPLSAKPAEVVGDFRPWAPAVQKVSQSSAQVALSAVADLQQWLAIGQDQVATLAGYAPRSVKNWREGMGPYPATVRRLFDVHALVGALIREMGDEGARLWLASGEHDGTTRRDLLADDAGLRAVISEASATIFEPPTVAPLHSLDFEEEVPTRVSQRPELFAGPVRRARRHS